MEEFEEKFIKPIVNACYPATLAGLDLASILIYDLSYKEETLDL